MTKESSDRYTRMAIEAGFNSLASVGHLPQGELHDLMKDKVESQEICAMHSAAKKEYNDVQILEKKILARASPLLPHAIQLGLKHPDASIDDYKQWFGRRSAQFVAPGSVASMFSPAAYLTELYRNSKDLYPSDNDYHIDKRRPDLKALVLSQKNLDTSVSALSLSNEILIEKVRDEFRKKSSSAVEITKESIFEELTECRGSLTTPYHHYYNHLRQIRLQKDPDVRKLSAAPQVLKHITGPTLAGIHFDISPALHSLLISKIDVSKFNDYFPGMSIEALIQPHALRNWYALTDNEISSLLGIDEYDLNRYVVLHEQKLVEFSYVDGGDTSADKDTIFHYCNLYLESDGGLLLKYKLRHFDTESRLEIFITNSSIGYRNLQVLSEITRRPNTEYTLRLSSSEVKRIFKDDFSSMSFDLIIKRWSEKEGHKGNSVGDYRARAKYKVNNFDMESLLRFDKLARLYKSTGLPIRELKHIINSADSENITNDTLVLLVQTIALKKYYNIPYDDALVMGGGLISQYTSEGEISQWNRFFNINGISDLEFHPDPKMLINLHPDDKEFHIEKAILTRALQTNLEGLYTLGCILFQNDDRTIPILRATHRQISALYTLSMWARLHMLTPHELQQLLNLLDLPEELVNSDSSVWQVLLNKISFIVGWLREHSWTVADLVLMTRDVSNIPVGTNISNLLKAIQDVVSAIQRTDDSVSVDHYSALSPLISATFNLRSETAALALLTWADRASPGKKKLIDIWNIFLKSNPTPADNRALSTFAYGLAQMALIIHATRITPDALSLFVTKPEILSILSKTNHGDTPTLACNVETIIALTEFSEWMRTFLDNTGVGTTFISKFFEGGIKPELLAQVAGYSTEVVIEATAEAASKGDVMNADHLASWAEIDTVRQWIRLAQVFNVMPTDLGKMLGLDYLATHKKDLNWKSWQAVANAFSAGLSPSQTKAAYAGTEPVLSKALAGYLRHVNNSSATTIDQYLLLDSLNGSQVNTSRISEAITALQSFIHRTLAEPEDSNALIISKIEGQFFRNWGRWNSRFATWAAGKQLLFYPENYIDPTVRLGQTTAMDELLQALGQAQVNSDTVENAFQGYLSAFEEVADLKTISAWHETVPAISGKTWFIGCSRGDENAYWWRSVDESRRNGSVLPANAWTGWTKITCAVSPIMGLIRPVFFKGRLHIGWVERHKNIVKRNDEGLPEKTESRWELKIAWLRYDGSWSAPVVHTYFQADVRELDAISEQSLPLSMYLSTWGERNQIVAAVYSPQDKRRFAGEMTLSEDMQFTQTRVISSNEDVLANILDTDKEKRVGQPLEGIQGPKVDQHLSHPTQLPAGFNLFEHDAFNVQLISANDAEKMHYRLKIGAILNIRFANIPEIESEYLSQLVAFYPELRGINSQQRALIGTEGAAIVYRDELYLCTSVLRYEGRDILAFGDYKSPIETVNVSRQNGRLLVKYKLGTPSASMNLYYVHVRLNGRPSTGNISLEAATLVLTAMIKAEPQESLITPTRYFNSPPTQVRAHDISLSLKTGVNTDRVYSTRTHRVTNGRAQASWGRSFPSNNSDYLIFSGKEVEHTLTLKFGSGERSWKLRVYKDTNNALKADVIGERVTERQTAQFLTRHGTHTRLNTIFARQLTERAVAGIDSILNYGTQEIVEPPLPDGPANPPMDFGGANAIYFWELFYYTPMMVMQRFLQEERFDLAEQWLKYVFNPAGYTTNGKPTGRLWNVRPLQEDTTWNDEPLGDDIAYDPDAVAQNDPMHYKLNAFMRLLDILIGRGDAAYRQLERDTLAEAKTWYLRALRLIGETPWVGEKGLWSDISLSVAASKNDMKLHIDKMSLMSQGMKVADLLTNNSSQLQNINQEDRVRRPVVFYPEANRMLLNYRDTLELRLYNLRHNLTLDGQPLNLALYATPDDPKVLLAGAVAAAVGNENALPVVRGVPALRFTPLLEGARAMASQLIQFGSTMQGILERQDAEALAQLLNTQGTTLADSSVALQRQMLAELAAERTLLQSTLSAAIQRRDHYYNLFQGNISAREQNALLDTESAQKTLGAVRSLSSAYSVASIIPNIFGLANGGSVLGASVLGAVMFTEASAEIKLAGANRAIQEEQFRRRREEWEIQYKNAQKEIEAAEAQLTALDTRNKSAEMHIAHQEMQAAQAREQLALLRGKFTGKAMYSWLRARLATIFYTYYDLAATRCLMAQKALAWELGEEKSYLRTGTWTGSWAGLLCGEGLMLALGQMENAWVKWQKRELEVTRTVSLAAFFKDKLKANGEMVTLNEAVKQVLNGSALEYASEKDIPNKLEIAENGSLSIHFDLQSLGFTKGFEGQSKRIRSIGVTLPALLGPYQDVRARLRTDIAVNELPSGCNECAISHGIHDNGLFSPDGGDSHPRWGAQWLPFEGMNAEGKSRMTLSFEDAKVTQKALLETLNDVILHIQFTVR